MSIFVLAGCMAAVVLAAVLIGYSFGVSASAVNIAPASAATLQLDEPPPTNTLTPTPPPVQTIEPPITSGSIAVPGFERLTVKESMLQADGVINPARNNCYFIVSFMLTDGTEIYRSGILAPGQSVGVVALTSPLVPGTYESVVARYSCYSSENMQPLNGADIAFTLEVLS